MAKAPKRAFVCNECGADYPRWQGQCSACHAEHHHRDAHRRLAAGGETSVCQATPGMPACQKLSEISGGAAAFLHRI